LKKIILIVAIVVVLAAAGLAAWLLFLRPEPEAAVESEEVAEAVVHTGPVQYLELAPSFVVNFPHQGRQRYMQASLSVMSRDSEALAAVTRHMPLIRHNLINLFSAQLLLVFEDPSGIEHLRQLATQEVQQVLLNEIGREGVDEVLFTDFVMQ
jgi:flagellar FliL protein